MVAGLSSIAIIVTRVKGTGLKETVGDLRNSAEYYVIDAKLMIGVSVCIHITGI